LLGTILVTIFGGIIVTVIVTVILAFVFFPEQRKDLLNGELQARSALRALSGFVRPKPFLKRHQTSIRDAVAQLPGYYPPFTYSLSRWQSWPSMQHGDPPDEGDLGSDGLIPYAAVPVYVVIGRSGRGKTVVSRELLAHAAASDYARPVYIDLRLIASRDTDYRHMETKRVFSRILRQAALPPGISTATLQVLAARSELVLIIDGINEVSDAVRDALAEEVGQLLEANPDRVRVVAFTRPSASSANLLAGRSVFFMVNELATDEVRHQYDIKCGGAGSYDGLTPETQELLRQPFFLDLALKGGAVAAGQVLNRMLRRFLTDTCGLADATVAQISEICAASEGREIGPAIGARLNGGVLDAMKTGGVVAPTGELAHDNWTNFFFGLHLAREGRVWSYEELDRATVFGAQTDALVFALDEMAPLARTAALKSVYDWNYPAAAICASAEQTEPADAVRAAILASVGLKRFDEFESTRAKAARIFADLSSPLALEVGSAPDVGSILEIAARFRGDGGWFDRWFGFAAGTYGDLTPPEWAESVGASDSVMGWAAANAAHVGELTTHDLSALRDLFTASVGPGQQSVRWRVVHVLGAHPSRPNISLLANALTDPDHWVRYGALRSLAEIGARGADWRIVVIDLLTTEARRLQHGRTEVDRLLQGQLEAGATIRGADQAWQDAISAVLATLNAG
jgi:hypothetical protein